jgi:hypothetical protein
MLRDAAVSRIKTTLGFKQNLDSQIVQAMVEVQEDLEREPTLPFFLRYAWLVSGMNVLTPGQYEYILPTNFIREDEEGSNLVLRHPDTGAETALTRDDITELRLKHPFFGENGEPNLGKPQGYFRMYRNIGFLPTPDIAYQIAGVYYGKDLPLTTNIENRWLKELPFIIIARAGLLIAGALRDQFAITQFGAMNLMMTKKLNEMSTADDMAGKKLVIGGEN